MTFYIFIDLRLEGVVNFVDVDGTVDHYSVLCFSLFSYKCSLWYVFFS